MAEWKIMLRRAACNTPMCVCVTVWMSTCAYMHVLHNQIYTHTYHLIRCERGRFLTRETKLIVPCTHAHMRIKMYSIHGMNMIMLQLCIPGSRVGVSSSFRCILKSTCVRDCRRKFFACRFRLASMHVCVSVCMHHVCLYACRYVFIMCIRCRHANMHINKNVLRITIWILRCF